MITVLQPMSNGDQQHSKSKSGSVLLSPLPVPAQQTIYEENCLTLGDCFFGVFFFGIALPMHILPTEVVTGCSAVQLSFLIVISAMANF